MANLPSKSSKKSAKRTNILSAVVAESRAAVSAAQLDCAGSSTDGVLSLVEEARGPASLLSGSCIPPTTFEQEALAKIALLEKQLAEATAKNSSLVDQLQEYILQTRESEAKLETAIAKAAAAAASSAKREQEIATLEKNLTVAEAKLARLQDVAGADTMAEKLRLAEIRASELETEVARLRAALAATATEAKPNQYVSQPQQPQRPLQRGIGSFGSWLQKSSFGAGSSWN